MGNGTDIKWVDSVLADLKPTTAATLGATVALAKGLGAATDGGGGVYQWFGTAATAEDGEHLVNRTGGGGRWERINGARTYFNVLDHGLVRTRLRTHASTISSTGTTVTTASGVADIIGASASITANGETRRVVTVVNPTTLTIDMAFTPDLPAGTKFSYMNRRGSGTLSISGTAVTGSGTSFASELLVGETIVAAGQAFVVASIASNTSLTITTSATVASTTFDHYFDNRSKLADLIEVVDKAGGGTIFFPAGTYVFAADGSNKVITVAGRTNLRFLGEGPASRLLWYGQFSGAGHFFDVTLGSRFITFEQLALLEGDGAKTDTSVQHHAIRINNEPVLGTDLINNIEHIAVLNCYFGAMPGDGVNCCGGTAQNACLADIPANVSPIGGTIKNPRNPQRVTVRYFKDWDGGDITIHGTIEPVRGRRVALAGHVVTLLAKQAKAFSVGMTVIASPNQSGASFRTGTTTVTAVHTADPGIPGDVDTITLANAAAISGFSDQDYLFELVSETVVAPVPVTAAFETRVTETEFRKIYGVTKSATGMLNPSPKASIGFAYLVRDVHVVGNTFNGFDYSGRTNGNDLNNSGFRCAVAAQRLSTDIFIQRNQMTGCGGQLIDFEPSGIGTTDHWVIEDNVIVNANPVGAALETAVTLFGVAHPYNRHNRRSRFCNNAVYGRILGGQMTGCDISDNVIVPIHGATMSAVSLTGRCDDVIVAGNQILPGPGVTATPISFTLDAGFSATGVTVRDNRIEWYGNTGMELDGVTSATVAGNHFAYRSTNVNTGKALRLDSPANRLVGRISIEGNIIEGDRGGGSLEHGISISHGPPLAFQAIG
ncbi:MAG TPA: hypothetical protein VFD53_01605, partial [Ilumatobacter sp.]|nr:hypothetical protein [Ilumatobacter sp.]